MELFLEEFHTEETENCVVDALKSYNGLEATKTKLVTRTCGTLGYQFLCKATSLAKYSLPKNSFWNFIETT